MTGQEGILTGVIVVFFLPYKLMVGIYCHMHLSLNLKVIRVHYQRKKSIY